MAAEPERIYLDACVILSYIDGDEDRLPDIDELLRRGASGDVELMTSVLSHVEVAFATQEKTAQTLDAETEEQIDELWTPNSPIQSIEFYPQLARQARHLIRDALPRGWSLKPHDAMHLATAVAFGCEQFFTYDEKLPKYTELTGLRIAPPANPQGQFKIE